MEATERTQLIISVHNDMRDLQAKIDSQHRLLADLRIEMENLARISSYLERQAQLEGQVEGKMIGFLGACQSNAGPTIDSVSPINADTNQLANMLEGCLTLSGPDRPRKAIELAIEIVPNYDAVGDGRNFESRIFALMRRRPNTFASVGRGLWTLTKYVQEQERMAAFGFVEDEEVEEPIF